MLETTAVSKVCESCGKRYRSGNHRFCSMDCRSASARGACSFDGCESTERTRGLCSGHAEQRRRGKALCPLRERYRHPRPCSMDGCESTVVARGLCIQHYREDRGRRLGPCSFDGCERNAVSASRGLCGGHARQASKGRELRPLISRGSGNIDRKGYRRVYKPTDPMAGANGMVFEHRWVMAQHLGRPLAADETVHHVNGRRAENHIGNLELWAARGHKPGQRVDDLIADAIALLRRYRPDALDMGYRS